MYFVNKNCIRTRLTIIIIFFILKQRDDDGENEKENLYKYVNVCAARPSLKI